MKKNAAGLIRWRFLLMKDVKKLEKEKKLSQKHFTLRLQLFFHYKTH